ncbi:MAG: FAD-binding oxidoreductase [Deltaproteobacteria bacterium]
MARSDREEKIASFLEGVVGKDYVSTSIFEKIKQSVDPMPYHAEQEKLPIVVVLPETKEQISEILKFANSETVPVFVRGSGTQLAGSSRPHTPGIVLNTSRLTSFEIKEDYGFFESEPGVRVAEAGDMLAARGWFLPIMPGSRVIASMGGVISNNTSGHIIDAAIGKLADYVLGVEAVLPTGEIIETGTTGMRKPGGTDLTKMFVGGDGIMGVVTKIRMRLIPMLQQSYGIAIYKDLKPIARGVKNMYLEKAPAPLLTEFMDQNVSRIAFEIKGMEPPPGPVIFFVGVGQDKAEADKKMNTIMEVFKKEAPISAYAITDLEEWKKLWVAREVIAPYLMNKLEGKLIAIELVSNLAHLEEAMEEGAHFNKGIPYLEDLTNYYFGHIGALTMHPTFILPPDWDDSVMREISKHQFRKEAEFNVKYGTCGGEWGQFSKRTPFFVMRYGETSYELVKKLKAVFDPNNILNPGILEGYR